MRKASRLPLPAWATPYSTGTRVGRAQALTAYADYYGLSGIADDMNDADHERLPLHRPPMQAYASRTGTRRNLDAMRAAGWRLIVSPTGVLRTEGMAYALDNGAWTAFQQGRPFDDNLFWRAVGLGPARSTPQLPPARRPRKLRAPHSYLRSCWRNQLRRKLGQPLCDQLATTGQSYAPAGFVCCYQHLGR